MQEFKEFREYAPAKVEGEVRENLPLNEVRPKHLAKNGQIGWCFDELDEWGWGRFGEIRACESGFRTEEMLVRDFVRGVLGLSRRD